MNRCPSLNFLATCLSTCIALAVSRVAPAADPPTPATKPAAKSLDDELLQGLDNKLQNGIDDKPATDDSKKPIAKPTEKPADKPAPHAPDQRPPADQKPSPLLDPLDEQLENSLNAGEDLGSAGEGNGNPLARIVVKMRKVQQRLAQNNSDSLTQNEQKRISDELKSLIDQIAQQQQQQPSNSSAPQQSSRDKPKQGNAPPGHAPGDPDKQRARDSSPGVRRNHTDRPDPAAAREVVTKELDRLNLPEKDREEMLQAPPDEFLPGHESSIEQYFKRLIEQEDERP
jgi:hypothetical protein